MIATVRDATHADYGAQYVGMLVSIIPMVIVFCFASKIIMEKISIGAAGKGINRENFKRYLISYSADEYRNYVTKQYLRRVLL